MCILIIYAYTGPARSVYEVYNTDRRPWMLYTDDLVWAVLENFNISESYIHTIQGWCIACAKCAVQCTVCFTQINSIGQSQKVFQNINTIFIMCDFINIQ